MGGIHLFNKKLILLIILVIGLMVISSVSANDNLTNTINNNENDDISDSLGIDEHINDIKKDDVINKQDMNYLENSDNSILTESYGTFEELNNLIKETEDGGTLTLNQNYKKVSNIGLNITKAITIEGNGYTIDINKKSARNIYISNNAIVKNTNFINGYNYGIEIENAFIIGCNFENFDNFNDGVLDCQPGFVTIINSNFNNNVMVGDGSVLWADMTQLTIINCTFNNNNAEPDTQLGEAAGGALSCIDSNVSISNSTFKDNFFKSKNDCYGGGAIDFHYCNVIINNSNFTHNYVIGYPKAGGGAISYRGGNKNSLIINNSQFNDNSVLYRNGGALYVSAGNYNEIEIKNSKFTNNSAPNGGAISFYVVANNNKINLYNSSFKNNEAEECGGGIYSYTGYQVDINLDSCVFESNQVLINEESNTMGGAVYIDSNKGGKINNCTFSYNQALIGGAIYLNSNNTLISTSSFVANVGYLNGGAIYLNGNKCEISSSILYNNAANNDAGVYWNGMEGVIKDSILLTSGTKYVIYSKTEAITVNYNWWGNTAKNHIQEPKVLNRYNIKNWLFLNISTNSNSLQVGDLETIKCDLMHLSNFYGIISEYSDFNLPNIILTAKNNKNGEESIINLVDGVGECNFVAKNAGIDSYNIIYKKIIDSIDFNISKDKTKISSVSITTTYNSDDYLIATLKDSKGNVISGATLFIELNGIKSVTTDKNGQIKLSIKGLTSKTYNVIIRFEGNEDYAESMNTATVIINKDFTELTAKAITTVYNVNKNLIITLKDSHGKPISGSNVIININGGKNYKTDKNGQIKINSGVLVPKIYTSKITFAGNNNYISSSTIVKIDVKKATPKLTAKAKTFKKSLKTKKYTVTLKTNKNKVMKNVKVTIKVNKKTYSAKTNTKGVATFKITKLIKKGTFKATITYSGDKYYNKVTKKVKITIK